MPLQISEETKAAIKARSEKIATMTEEERRAFFKAEEAERQERRKTEAAKFAAWMKAQKRENEGKRKELIRELRALLEKYGATIGFTVGEGSDTYGLHGESIGLSMEVGTYPGHTRPETIIAVEVDGWHISPSDLK